MVSDLKILAILEVTKTEVNNQKKNKENTVRLSGMKQ